MAHIKKVQIGQTSYLIEPTLYITPSLSNGVYSSSSLTDFTLDTGVAIQVQFTDTNPVDAQLKINDDTKYIYYNGNKIAANIFKTNHTYTLVYDGIQWQVVGDIDTDTTYTNGTGLNLSNGTFSVKYGNTTGTAVEGNDSRLSDARTPTSHTHGNIQNNGTLQTNDVTIADGDKLVITDTSNDGKIARASISFDGATATKALTQKGTWETFNNYSLPLAASGTRGGIQIGYNGTGKNYAVQLDNEKAYVNVPWTDQNVTQSADTSNNDIPILLKGTSGSTTVGAVKYPNTTGKIVTVNPSTGAITAPGGFIGNASSATQTYITHTVPTSATSYYITAVGSTTNGNQDLINNELLRIYLSAHGANAYLNVGNATKYGGITLHSGNGFYGNIVTDTLTTNNKTYTLPNKTGTIALVSDIPTTMAWSSITGKPTKITLTGAVTGEVSLGDGDLTLSTTANHTYALSIATDTGTSALTMYAATKYKLTAGGSTYIFTTQDNAHLLSPIELTTEDLDDYKTAFKTYYGKDGNEVKHKPDGVTSFGLTVKQVAANYRLQDLITSGGTRYYRIWDNSTWSAWTQIKLTDTTYTVSSPLSLSSGNISFSAQAHNTVLAGPSATDAANAAPIFRSLVADDIPDITKSKISDFSHTHGNITNDGKMSGSTVSGAVATTDKFLREDGTWTVPAYTVNTDSKVSQTASTTSKWRKILLGHKEYSAYNTAITGETDVSYEAVGIAAQPSTGSIRIAGSLTTGSSITAGGLITAQANQYTDGYTGALNMSNSNIYGVNAIYMADTSDAAGEGIHFYRSATTVDSLWVNGGNIYFVPNRTITTDNTTATNTTAANSEKVLRLPASITGSRAVYSDGSSGKLAESTTTSTELGYVHGVTSAIQTQLDTKAPLASPEFTGTPTAPTADNGTNTTQIATTAFVNNTLTYAKAMTFKGTLGTNGTVTTLPASHNAGDTYRVITAGTWAGKTCVVGDLIICVNTGTAAADADWTSVETNEDGAVIGPAEADGTTDNAIVRWNSTTGRVIQNSKVIIDDNGCISTTQSGATATNYKVTNSNGSVGIYTATNRGLYDFTKPGWIIYRAQNGNNTYISQWASIGTATAPVYFNASGEPTAGNTYAGGTKVTLNGTAKGASTASFYAPTTAGTAGQYLKSTAGAPEWATFPNTWTPSSHTHGNITNDGKISETETIGNNYRLVIVTPSNASTDADKNNVITSSIVFDGSTATKALTQKGTWETFNNYSHPTSAGNKHIPSGGSTGQFLKYGGSSGTATWSALPTASTDAAGIIQIGTDASDAMAGNTNVNNVTQGTSTSSSWRKIILAGGDTQAAWNTAVVEKTSQVYQAVEIAAQPSTGTLRATILQGGSIALDGSTIKYYGSKSTESIIKFLNNSTNTNGNGIGIASNGPALFGGGEGAVAVRDSLAATGTENLYLIADASIYIESTANTTANRVGFKVVNGNILPTKAESTNHDNQLNIGASNNKWANVYATTFHGALTGDVTGNADTATKWADAQNIKVVLGTQYGNGTGQSETAINGGQTTVQTIAVDGVLKVSNGGTGANSVNAYGVVYGNSSANAYDSISSNAEGQVFIGHGASGSTSAPSWYSGLLLTGAGTAASPYNAIFANDVSITGDLIVTATTKLTSNVGIGTDPDNNYLLYVDGETFFNDDATINGDLIPTISSENAALQSLGTNTNLWTSLFIDGTYGDEYTPIYWDDTNGKPATSIPLQYIEFTISQNNRGVTLASTAFTANSYVVQIVITDGESNLNSIITWTSSSGSIALTCDAVNGAVEGYILVARGGNIQSTITATQITPSSNT